VPKSNLKAEGEIREPKDKPLLDITVDAVSKYGKHTIEDRAMPDFRDGLKPVARRILWAMKGLGLVPGHSFVKSARVVGETIGKFHPHGDQACYGALVTMGNLSEKLVEPQGNFGNDFTGDAEAAQRYTECRLSKFAAEHMVSSLYLNVIKTHPNYDGKDIEPLYFPATAPNILLNGTYGIAVGATSIIPPFHKKGVIKLIGLAMNGETITPKMCLRNLRVNYPRGGQLANSDDELLEFYRTGKGTLKLRADYTVDKKQRLIIITGAPFGVTQKKLNDKLNGHDLVASIADASDKTTGPIHFVVRVKNSVSPLEMEAVAEKLVGLTDFGLSTAVGITRRLSETEKEFEEINIPNLIMEWAKYRVGLEKRVQEWIIKDADRIIADLELLKLAASKRDIIFAAIKRDDPDDGAAYIMQKLEINKEQAKRILDLAVRRLSKLSEKTIDADIVKARKRKKTAVATKANPVPRIMEMLETI